MNDPVQPQAGQDRTTAIVYGVVGSLIATALVAGGAWLAGRQVPDETILQFSLTESRVGKLSAWAIRVSNGSDVAFDVQLSPPTDKLVRHEYSPKMGDTAAWKGQLAKGHALESLFIYEDSATRLSAAAVQSMITASYQERNSLTGAMENRTGEVRDANALPLARTALLVLWFLLPTLAASGVLLLPKGWKALKKRLKWS